MLYGHAGLRTGSSPKRQRKAENFWADLVALGAGFELAAMILDIRGAGNLLGNEQSGHIKEVGFRTLPIRLLESDP